MPDSLNTYAQIVSNIINDLAQLPNRKIDKKSVEWKRQCEKTQHGLYDPGFICYFLNFLRESSSPAIKGHDTETYVASEHFSKTKEVKVQFEPLSGHEAPFVTRHESQMMSTPKAREDVVTPKSNRNFTSSFTRENTSRSNPKTSYAGIYSHSMQRSDVQTPQSVGFKADRQKQKPLSLSDFLSPDAGSISGSGRRVKNKPPKMKKGTPTPNKHSSICSFQSQSGISDCSTKDRKLVSHQNSLSLSYSMSSHRDAKSPANPLFSEASRSISFDMEKDFPSLHSEPLKTLPLKPTRRIKPTAIAVKLQASPMQSSGIDKKSHQADTSSDNPFTSATPTTLGKKSDLRMERDLLKIKRDQNRNSKHKEVVSLKPPMKSLDDISPVKKVVEELDPSLVFAADKIQRLVELYAVYINSFLVPCVITEIQFILDLLTVTSSVKKTEGSELLVDITGSLCKSTESNAEDADSKPMPDLNILSTAANAIHFAVQMLQALLESGVISIIPRATISLLAHNDRIQNFMPSLQTELLSLAENLEVREKELLAEPHISQEKQHSILGVPFEAETDDRSNFASDKSFHAFRKHRDLFYSLVREYEQKRLRSDFNIQPDLGGKIRHLVNQVKTSGTYRPFTRLFVSQMLQGGGHELTSVNCSNQSLLENSYGENRLDLLASLRLGDPEKFRRLQSRFVTTSTPASNGMNDALLAQCYFYQEFVLCADSYALNVHLCNELQNRISDIESQQSQQLLDDVSAESVNISSVSTALSQMINASRILGRFLGFLTFQPYDSDDPKGLSYAPNTLTRITYCLDHAIACKRKILTVPWTTEYLKFANFSSGAGCEAWNVLEKLFSIYRDHTHEVCAPLASADIMIALAISTLFEMPVFPEDCFFQLLKKAECNQYSPKTVCLTASIKENDNKNILNSNPSIDGNCIDLISFSLIYGWHQSLREIRSSVITYNSGTSNRSSRVQQPPRKIKPSTEVKSEETLLQKKEKQLQSVLEDHFFRGQPSSLRRTVAFVAERCASNCVKHIRSVSMLEICSEAEDTFVQRCSQNKQMSDSEMEVIRIVVREMKALAVQRMHEKAKSFCEKAVLQCMEDLSSCEVLSVATAIANKKALASVHAWLDARLDELVAVSVKARLIKVLSNAKNSEQGERFDHEDDFSHVLSLSNICSVSSLLQTMKEYIVKLTYLPGSGTTFNPVSVDSSIPRTLSEHDVSAVLGFAASLLNEEQQDVLSKLGDGSEAARARILGSMITLLNSSLHLKSSLALAAKELSARSELVFKQNCIGNDEYGADDDITNMRAACT